MAGLKGEVRRPRRSVLAALAVALGSLGAPLTPADAAGPEGGFDAAFGTSGKVITPVSPAGSDLVSALALQPDGKLVVVGASPGSTTGSDFAVVRYRADGTLDTTFNGTGMRRIPVRPGNVSDSANAVAVQSDGKIVVAGRTTTDARLDWALVRLNPNGTLDSTFGSGGRVITEAVGVGNSSIVGVAVQPDGKVVVAGWSHNGTFFDFAAARYRANGTLDPSFNGTGIAKTPVGAGSALGAALALHDDGSIVVVGRIGTVTRTAAVVRYRSDGALDTGFDGDGKATFPVGDDSTGRAVAIQADGRILVVGSSKTGADTDFMTLRLKPSGLLDPSFGTGGKVVTPIGVSTDEANGVVVQPDGKIVVAGYTVAGVSRSGVVRYHRDGTLDTAFGDGGKLTLSIGATLDSTEGVALQRNGRIVAAATADDGGGNDFSVYGLVGDGTPPFGGRTIGLPRWSRVLTRTLAWTATDDNTGVARYDVRRRVATSDAASFGAYGDFTTNRAVPIKTFTSAPGRTVCFGVRARDRAGNLGAYGLDDCTAYPVNDTTLTRSGTWSVLLDARSYMGTASRTTTAGASLSTRVAYRRLALVVTKCPSCGKVEVLLGSKSLGTYDLAATKVRRRAVVNVDASAAVRKGMLRIRATAGKPVTIEGVGVSLV
jgi:uncharacterized delta-60 repeat protein